MAARHVQGSLMPKKVELLTYGQTPDGRWIMILTAGGKTHEFEMPDRMIARLLKEWLAAAIG